jgi:non-homologous end joining protein Ku
MIWPVCKVVVERDDLVRGSELSKGNYVQITEEELETLEAEANNGIEFREFVPNQKKSIQFTSRAAITWLCPRARRNSIV